MGMRIEETRSPSGAASEVIMKTLTDECGRFSVPIDVTEAAQKVGIEVKRLRAPSPPRSSSGGWVPALSR